MNTFTPSKRLINFKFDGYKLEPIAQEKAVSRFSLQFTPSQATVTPGGTPLSFQEVQSRITHNHLAVESDSGRAIYVDSGYRIILVDINKVSTIALRLVGVICLLRFPQVGHARTFFPSFT